MKESYSEIKCDYNNQEGFWCVDAWRTGDDNEEGKVVAVIHEKSGDVYYCEPEARLSPKVAEAIAERKAIIKASTKKKPVPVQVTCYGTVRRFRSVDKAIKVFEECQMNSEGSERDRYTNILIKLRRGETIVDDSRP